MRHHRQRLTILVAAATIAAHTLCAAQWETETTVDPITDRIAYHVWTFGSEIAGRYGTYAPKLAIRFIPIKYESARRRLIIEPDVFIWCPAIKRKTQSAKTESVVRFDDAVPVKTIWTGSDNRCALFCSDQTNVVRRIMKSHKLTVRFTHSGYEVTSVFDVTGLSDELAKVRIDYLKRIGLHAATPAPQKTSRQNHVTREQIHAQIAAAIEGELDAQSAGYYADMKNWIKAKRLADTAKKAAP